MIKNLDEHIKQWTEENAPLGKELGYPECCIKAFCDQPPILLEHTKVTKEDKRRYKAGCIDGQFTGFIPCASHALEIITGKITLHSLIQNRNPDFPPFPKWGVIQPSNYTEHKIEKQGEGFTIIPILSRESTPVTVECNVQSETKTLYNDLPEQVRSFVADAHCADVTEPEAVEIIRRTFVKVNPTIVIGVKQDGQPYCRVDTNDGSATRLHSEIMLITIEILRGR